jgi:hypothetical protein
MGVRRMKTNIYQKLHTAACEASGVTKGKKVPGMQFNPLLHDDVQNVAMEALLNNGLYPVCNYTNTIHENFIVVTCSMRIHDIENPDSYVDVNGCSAMGNLDKFGTGNGMSYAKKYAYLNALHLKTGLDNDDGYKAKPFEEYKVLKEDLKYRIQEGLNKIPKTNGKKNIKLDMQFDIDRIRLAIKDINGLKALRDFKKENPELFDSNNMSVREYKQITDLYETRQIQLNTQGVTQ